MAKVSTYVPFGDATVAVLQSLNQYSTGLVGGYLIDQIMNSVPISESNVSGRMFRQIIQVALNGLAINFMLKAIHGTETAAGYRDPSGGYLLLVGLLQGQQTFMKNGKDLITGLTMFLKELLFAPNQSANIQTTPTNPPI